MHLTLKQATTRPAAANLLLQQARFDDFREEFNDVRPHEALQMQTPATVHKPSERRLPKELPPLEYPLHDAQKRVSLGGCLRLENTDLYVSKALAGQDVGLRHLEAETWLMSFTDFDLAYLDLEQRAVVPIDQNPEKKTG